MSYVPNALLLTLGRTDLIARCQVSLVIPYLFGSAFLIHRFGAAGAAVAWSLRSLAGVILSSYFARCTSGFAFAPWLENKRSYVLTSAILLLPMALAAFLTTSAIVRIGVASAPARAYAVPLLTWVLTDEERTALQRMVPFGLGGR